MSAKGKVAAFRLFPEDDAKLDLIAEVLKVTKSDALRLCIHQFDASPKGVASAMEKRMQAASFGIERIGIVELSPRSISKREVEEIREACGYTGAGVKHKKQAGSSQSEPSSYILGEDLGEFSLGLDVLD